MSDDTWEYVTRIPGSVVSQGLGMLVGADADSIYIFENRETGERVRVYASSLDEAGEKLADGDYSSEE